MGSLAFEGAAQGATYYTSRSGSDSNSCATAQSTSSPKATVNGGISCLSAGDTLLVRGGTYDEQIASVPSGTSWSSVVRIAAYPGETVWVKPTANRIGVTGVIWLDGNFSYVEFDGINADETGLPSGLGEVIWFSTNNGNNPHHIRYKNAEIIAGAIGENAAVALGGHTRINATGSFELQHLRVHGGGRTGAGCDYTCNSYGIYIAGPNNLVEDCEIYDNASGGMQIYNSSGDSPDNNIVRRNYIHDQTRVGNPAQLWGIIIAGNNNQIYNNVFSNIRNGAVGDGIDFYSGNNNQVYNNTIYNVAANGINVSSSVSGATIRNNISYNSGINNYTNNGIGTIQDHNLIGTNPSFVNAGASDFHLQATSRAVDAGVTIATVATDMDGTTRPQGSAYDIGAYEFRGTAQLSPPTGLRIVPN